MTVTQVLLDCLRGAQVRSRTATAIRRAIVLLGVVGVTAGVTVLTAAAAQAVTGSEPGHLRLHPATGATTRTPTWSTTDGCPADFRAGAVLYALNIDGSIGSRISPVLYSVSSAFHGTLLGPVGKLLSLGTNVRRGGTSEWVVGCFAGRGGTGARKYVQAIDVVLSANGSSYTTSAAPKVSALSPASGMARGGNTVTIHGTNFIGVTAVHFGRKRATKLRVISATKITVTAPRGTGAVNVTVTSAAGISIATRSGRYHYK